MFRRYADFQVTAAKVATSKHAGFLRSTVAHRADFSHIPVKPGFLYVRSRAISSRVNLNFDEFPAEEIKKGYQTFIGKPVFVNHVNDNHRRARGVIVAAALHEDVNPNGSPDTWAEVLMEVDAVQFPKLAQKIVTGEVNRTSMGCDVIKSECSACGNVAADPTQYCVHIPAMKGMKIRNKSVTGSIVETVISERCFGLSFFENSILVEDPADPTAHFLGVEGEGVMSMAKVSSKRSVNEIVAPAKVDTMRTDSCPICGESSEGSFNGDDCLICGYAKPPDKYMDPNTDTAAQIDREQDDDPSDQQPASDDDVLGPEDDPDQGSDQGTLTCDSCGATFPPGSGGGVDPAPQNIADSGAGSPLPWPPQPQDSAPGPDAGGSPMIQQMKPLSPGGGYDDGPGLKQGDTCPVCGGTVRSNNQTQSSHEKHRRRGARQGDKRMRPALTALVAQQKQIERQNHALKYVADLAGVGAQVNRILADADNPAQPVKQPAPVAPTTTTGDERHLDHMVDVIQPGETQFNDQTLNNDNEDVTSVGGKPPTTGRRRKKADIAPSTTDRDRDRGDFVDVTQPIQGTTDPNPTEMMPNLDIEVADPQIITQPAFPLEDSFRDQPTVPRSRGTSATKAKAEATARTFACLRLAKMQIEAGVASGDEVTLAQRIEASKIGDGEIATAIATLASVRSAGGDRSQRRSAGANTPKLGNVRSMPSMASDRGVPDLGSSSAVSADEVLW